MKEVKIIISDMSVEKRVSKITDMINDGWDIAGFTDHQTLFVRNLPEEVMITEG